MLLASRACGKLPNEMFESRSYHVAFMDSTKKHQQTQLLSGNILIFGPRRTIQTHPLQEIIGDALHAELPRKLIDVLDSLTRLPCIFKPICQARAHRVSAGLLTRSA